MKTSTFRKWFMQIESSIFIVLVLGILFQGFHMVSDWIMQHKIIGNIQLYDDVKQSRISLTKGQFLLERMFSGDSTIRIADILPCYQQSEIVIGEGRNGENRLELQKGFLTENKAEKGQMVQLNTSLNQFGKGIQSRLLSTGFITSSRIMDERISFYQLLSEIDKMDEHFLGNISKMMSYYKRMHWITLVWWLTILVVVCGFLFYHGKKRREVEIELEKSHNELEYRIAERTAQLSKTNELLNREINEHKQTLAGLLESETKYKNLFENMNSGVAVYEAASNGEDFIFQDFNKAGQRIENTPLENVIGKSVTDVFPGIKDFGLLDTFQRVWKTGKPEHHPIALYKDERISGWRDNFIYKLPSGQIVSVYSDETSRMQAEKALRESETKYRTLFENSKDPVYITSYEGSFIDVNQAFLDLFGYSREEIQKLKASDCYFDPDKRSIILKEFEQRKYVQDYELKLLKKNGQIIDCLITASLRQSDNGFILGYQGIVRDITGRKLAEQALRESELKYRSLFENMIVGYAYCKIILDQNHMPEDFVFLEINNAFQQLTGLKKMDVLGKKATEIIPTIRIDHPELFDDYGKTVMMGENVQFDIYFKALKIWLSISVYSPQQGYCVIMFENITGRKEAEEEIRQANEKQMIAHNQRKILSKRLIDLLEKDRRQIAMELHDHIGQSLTSLKINLEMLRSHTNPNEITLISQICRAEEKAIQILKDVKDVSHGLRPPVLDTLGLVSSLRELFNQVLQQMDMDIHFFNQGIPKRIGEEKELAIYRIAQEALSNIMKYAHAKTVYVNLVKTDGHISLSIEDDGVGFDKEEIATATNGKGSLGLLIMQERAKQLDGEFTLESRKGHGTHVLVEIPIWTK